jgi:hypothetical protein
MTAQQSQDFPGRAFHHFRFSCKCLEFQKKSVAHVPAVSSLVSGFRVKRLNVPFTGPTRLVLLHHKKFDTHHGNTLIKTSNWRQEQSVANAAVAAV